MYSSYVQRVSLPWISSNFSQFYFTIRVWKEITLNSTSDQVEYRVWDYPIKEQYGHILQAITQVGPVANSREGFQKVCVDDQLHVPGKSVNKAIVFCAVSGDRKRKCRIRFHPRFIGDKVWGNEELQPDWGWGSVCGTALCNCCSTGKPFAGRNKQKVCFCTNEFVLIYPDEFVLTLPILTNPIIYYRFLSYLYQLTCCRILDLQKDRYFEMLASKYWNQSLKAQCQNSDDNEGITLESLGELLWTKIFS